MSSINLKLDTLTNLGYFHTYKFKKFAILNDFIYIINPQKLDVILSLLEVLSEFNNYFNFFNKGNITSWLTDKGIATSELLNEISFYKIKNSYNEPINDIYSFINYKDPFSLYEPSIINFYLCYLLKENFKNMIIFDYLYNSQDMFNNYISEIFNYYKSINMTPTKSFENFIYSILEIDKIALQKELNYIDSIKIHCDINKTEDIFCIKKFYNSTTEFFQECLKNNLEITFKINTTDNYHFFKDLEKYLNISEFLTSKLLQDGYSVLHTINSYIESKGNYSLETSNFCFVNQSQILHFCLNEGNKALLNEILPFDYIKNSFEKTYLFEKDDNNDTKFVNYGKVKIF